MPYAMVEQVTRRAGRLSGTWTASTRPSTADVAAWLEEVSDKVDARLAGLGLTLPTDDRVAEALVAPVADEVLVLLLDASWPGGQGGGEVAALRDGANARVLKFWGDDSTAGAYRSEPAIAAALALAPSAVLGASSLWTEEPDYPTSADQVAGRRNPAQAPWVQRGQPL